MSAALTAPAAILARITCQLPHCRPPTILLEYVDFQRRAGKSDYILRPAACRDAAIRLDVRDYGTRDSH